MTINKPHLTFVLFVTLLAAIGWLVFSRFEISNIDLGYDPYRFMSHALGNCEGIYESACEQEIVKLLRLMGNTAPMLYTVFVIFVGALLYISLEPRLVPIFWPSFPILAYYLGQTGKDSFSVLGSISLFSLLFNFFISYPFRPFNVFLSFRPKFFLISLIRIFIVFLSLFLRPANIIIYSLILIMFLLLTKTQSANAFSRLRVILYLFIFVISSLLLQAQSVKSDMFESLNYYGSRFSEIESFSFLVGFDYYSYFLRILFNIIFPIIYPLKIILVNSLGFVYFLSLCLIVQFYIMWKQGNIFSFLVIILPLCFIVSTYPFPNIRYLLSFYPVFYALLLLHIHLSTGLYGKCTGIVVYPNLSSNTISIPTYT